MCVVCLFVVCVDEWFCAWVCVFVDFVCVCVGCLCNVCDYVCLIVFLLFVCVCVWCLSVCV